MIDYSELTSWLVVVVVLLAIPLVSTRRLASGRFASERMSALGAWAVERLTPAPEVDQLADDLYRVIRRERLRSDILRLRRILATDMDMSATRQLGNRIAYEWLLRELNGLRAPSPAGATASFPERGAEVEGDSWSDDWDTGSWDVRPLPPPTPEPAWSYEARPPKVEILEIGRRR